MVHDSGVVLVGCDLVLLWMLLVLFPLLLVLLLQFLLQFLQKAMPLRPISISW